MDKDDIAALIYVGQNWLPALLLMAVWVFFVVRPMWAKQRRAPPDWQEDLEWWRKHKALRIGAYAVWALAMISFFPMAIIETEALRQPDHPTGPYTEAMHVKGVLRYVTPNQMLWDNIAQFCFIGGIGGFAVTMLICRAIERK